MKENTFTEQQTEVATLAKALAHPARLAILDLLAERNTCICGEIVDDLPLAQSTVSQHLKALKEAGLVQGTIDGVRSCYCVDWEGLAAARRQVEAFFERLDHLSQTKTCC